MSKLCAKCGTEVEYGQEAWLLEVVTAVEGRRGLSRQVMLDDEGDYYQEPHFLHFDCWEQALSEAREAVADQPPALASKFAAKCFCCCSQIEVEEPYVQATVCEIHLTDKYPDWARADRLERLTAKGNQICFACVDYISEYFPTWGVFLQQLTELGDDDDQREQVHADRGREGGPAGARRRQEQEEGHSRGPDRHRYVRPAR